MKVTLESTTKMVDVIDKQGGVVPARVWEGQTDSGIPVTALITRIACRSGLESEFERELKACRPPSGDSIEAWPARLVL